MTEKNENKEMKQLGRSAVIAIALIGALGVLFVLDMVKQGLVYRALQTFRSPNNSTLPGDESTIGPDGNRVTLTYLS